MIQLIRIWSLNMTGYGKDKNEQVRGVGCSVVGCKYHEANGYCVAEHIDVRNEKAVTKAETFCATFTPCSSCAGDIL